MSFDRKRKSARRFVAPFFKRALRLKSIERAVHLDGGEPFRAEPEPLFLRRVAVEILAPAFVIPPAGADVCFAGHSGNRPLPHLQDACATPSGGNGRPLPVTVR